ncbi:TIGR00270 family protein [Candidatus Woesearchaeota archaeon]|nr:TIGR00270 family protein [Candidatus Woesearchaeota archaeon]
MRCDMCSASGELYRTSIEEAELVVCQKCSKFGKVISKVKQHQERKEKSFAAVSEKEESIEIISKNYAGNIKAARESLNLTQKELAQKLNEKESLIHQLESSHYEPSLELAKKLGSFLKINMIEEYKEKHENLQSKKAEAFTLGDFIKVKKKN